MMAEVCWRCESAAGSVSCHHPYSKEKTNVNNYVKSQQSSHLAVAFKSSRMHITWSNWNSEIEVSELCNIRLYLSFGESVKSQPGIQLYFFWDTFSLRNNQKLGAESPGRRPVVCGKNRLIASVKTRWLCRESWLQCTIASNEDSRGTELEGRVWVLFKLSDDDTYFFYKFSCRLYNRRRDWPVASAWQWFPGKSASPFLRHFDVLPFWHAGHDSRALSGVQWKQILVKCLKKIGGSRHGTL
jgi:hypothetical protein